MNDQAVRPGLSDWRQVLERYGIEHQNARAAVQSLVRRWNQLSYVRGTLFLAALIAGICAYQAIAGFPTVWWIAAGILAVIFLFVVAVHDQIERRLESSKQQVEFFAEAMARCQREWSRLPVPDIAPTATFRPISLDLDVFGRASLSQLLGTIRTAVGLPLLAEYLTAPASPEEIRARQAAASDLAKNNRWRELFQLNCRIAASSPVGSERFLEWIASPGWLIRRPLILWFARAATLLMIVFLAGFFTGWIPPQIAGVGALVLLGVNFMVTVFTSGKVHEIFENVSSRKNEVDQYVSLFRQVGELESNSSRLAHLREAVTVGRYSALHGLRSLSQIVWLGNLRRHGILFIAYLFLQFFALWDLHMLHRLEIWQRRYRERVPDWFAALGQAEILAALGTVSYEHPSWVFAQIDVMENPRIVAENLGHPLLPNDRRVCNDVELGPPGTVLIVTGSNMSGKSTLLRSVGLNMLLGQMGSVVCASKFMAPPIVMETSMRIDDSLADGVSFFMAELKRLKEIVDRSREIRSDGRQFLFLLDEILQGTNSRERHIAVGAVIHQLLAQDAVGSFTTHDLDLANEKGLIGRSRSVYFTESFMKSADGDTMTFDFIMRPGVAPTTNALKLLRIVGLSIDQDDPPAESKPSTKKSWNA